MKLLECPSALACCAAALLSALGAIDGYGKTPPEGPVDAYYGDVRKRLLDITPEAQALLDRLAEEGKAYRPIAGRTHLFVRTQLKYGLQRTDFLHNWYERPLYQDSTYAAASVKGRYLNELSWRRQVEVGKLSKLDGFAFFPSTRGRVSTVHVDANRLHSFDYRFDKSDDAQSIGGFRGKLAHLRVEPR